MAISSAAGISAMVAINTAETPTMRLTASSITIPAPGSVDPGCRDPMVTTRAAAVLAIMKASSTHTMRPTSRIALLRHGRRAQRQSLAGRELGGCTLELPASGQDVASARGADRRRIAGAKDDCGELLDHIPIRTRKRGARPWIERDQIDFGRNALKALHQRARVGERIVDTFEHHILKRDPAGIGKTRIVAAGRKQRGERILAIERHQPVA